MLEVDSSNANGKKDLEKFKVLLQDKDKENEVNQNKLDEKQQKPANKV